MVLHQYATQRIEPEEITWLQEFAEENKMTRVPVIIVLTQSFSEKKAQELRTIILEENLDVVQVVPVLAQDYEIDEHYTVEAYGLDRLIQVMEQALPEELQTLSMCKPLNAKKNSQKSDCRCTRQHSEKGSRRFCGCRSAYPRKWYDCTATAIFGLDK